MSTFHIRTLRRDDEDRLLQFERDNRIWFEAHIAPRGDAFYTPEGVRDHIEEYLHGYARATWHPCVIVDRTDAIVGRANLKNIDLATGMAEIGYRIAQQHAGRGLATDAVRYLTSLGRSQWGLKRLLAYVAVGNVASARVVEKCGFMRGERLPDMALLHGVPVDGHQFSCNLSGVG
jgi:ribosomal-protein-alanine N-acetyltransferase